MNDVWVFDVAKMEWKEVKTTGDIPSCRSNCSLNYDHINNRIIVFGGGGPNRKRFNSINVLDWETKEWTEILPICIIFLEFRKLSCSLGTNLSLRRTNLPLSNHFRRRRSD